MGIQTTLPASWETCMQVKKQLDMEQQTGSESGKEYIKAVYCHPAYLTYIQSESESVSCSVMSTFCNPMDNSPLESSARGILQARILEWVAIPFSRGHSRPRDQTQVSCIADRFCTNWATREALYTEYIMQKCQVGWIMSWNQGCREKYQQPQICRWYHPNGRKQRGTKEPFDEGERGQWKKLA